MKFIAELSALAFCASTVCPVAIKSSIPILNDALLKTSGGTLSMSATDMEMMVTAECAADVAADGAICVNAMALHHFVGSLPSDCWVEGALEDGFMVLRAGRSRCKLAVLFAADFPVFKSDAPASAALSFPAAELAGAIDRVAYAISHERTRYYLCGVYLKPEDNRLAFVATNGNVLARSSLPLPPGAKLPAVIVPAATVALLRKLLSAGDPIEINWTETRLSIVAGAVTVLSNLVSGTFPDYGRVVPERVASPVTAEREPLASILKRTAGIVERNKDGRAIRFDVETDGIEITGRGEHGEVADHIDARCVTPFSLTMNALAVRDTLEAMDGETVEMHSHGPGAPVLFVSERADDLYVVTSFRG